MLAIFGLVLFQNGIFSWMSFTAENGAVFGRSFLTAGAMMSLIALPMVFGSVREGLQSMPAHVREASYGLGKTKSATIRRVLLPSVRPNIGTGMALGMGRIAGDTAIVVILLGATLRLDASGSVPGVKTLQGTGSTLTSYVYNNSPGGGGRGAAEGVRGRVRAAADRHRPQLRRRRHLPRPHQGHMITRHRHGPGHAMDPALPPPVRRIVVDRPPNVALPPVERDATRDTTAGIAGAERMRLEQLTVAYGPKEAVKGVVSRSARARCSR